MTPAAPDGPLHILVVSPGTAGDLFPMLAVASALQRRGHRVHVMSAPPHAAHVARAGLSFEPLGTQAGYDGALANPDLWHPGRGFGVVWRSLQDTTDRVEAFVASVAAGQRCAVLAHPLALPAADIARACRPDLGIVGTCLAPANLRSSLDPMWAGPMPVARWVPLSWRHALWRFIDRHVVDPVARDDLNAQRARRGLAAVGAVLPHLYGVADTTVLLCPEWFAPTAADWPRPLVRSPFPLYDPDPSATLSPELAAFLAAGPAPVVFTAGSAHRHAAAYFAEAVAAARRLGCRAVLLTSDQRQVPPSLPPDVLWQRWVPLHALLPKASALVHHGGIGTTAEALRAGVPQLVTPFAHDQFDNGARVVALGVGHVLSASRLRARPIARALRELLSTPAVQTRCADVAGRFSQPIDLAGVCAAVEGSVSATMATDAGVARQSRAGFAR